MKNIKKIAQKITDMLESGEYENNKLSFKKFLDTNYGKFLVEEKLQDRLIEAGVNHMGLKFYCAFNEFDQYINENSVDDETINEEINKWKKLLN